MSNILLIIEREYLTRVKKKSFVIISLIAPLAMMLMMFMPILIDYLGTESTTNVAVIDRSGQYLEYLKDDNTVHYIAEDTTLEEEIFREIYDAKGYDAYLIINDSTSNQKGIKLCSSATLTLDATNKVNDDLLNAHRQLYIKNLGSQYAMIDSIISKMNSSRINVANVNIKEDGEENMSSPIVGQLVSVVSMTLIYMFILISGSIVMSSVLEEKSNRIIEVLISSVKPFDLMMGKIIGVALMTLTQFSIWVIVGSILLPCTSLLLPSPETDASIAMADAAQLHSNFMMNNMIQSIMSINFLELIIMFLFYFIGGYLLYASLYACIGASVDTQTDGQMLAFPITTLIIAAIYLALYAVHDPNSTISVAASIFPFTSPFVMMARLQFNVPIWQLTVSLVTLYLSFIASTWFAARVYRVGILMYGKKPSFKELWKWFRQSN